MTDTALPGIGHNSASLAEVLADTNKALIAEIDPIAARANDLAPKVKEGIKDETMLGTVAEIVTDAKALARRLDKRRTEEKDPYLKGGRDVDAFFKTFTDRLDRIASAFTDAASDYQRRKAAEERKAKEEEARKLREEEERKRQEAVNAKRETTTERKLDEAEELAAKAEEAEARARAAGREVEKVKTETGVSIGGKTEWTFEIIDLDAIEVEKLKIILLVKHRDVIEKALAQYAKNEKQNAKMNGVRFYEKTTATFRR